MEIVNTVIDTALLPFYTFDYYYSILTKDFIVAVDGIAFIDRHFYVLAAIAAAYLPITFGLKAWMKNRKPYNLRGALVVWNLLLVAFNLFAFVYLTPGILYAVRGNRLMSIYCDTVPQYQKGPHAFAIYLFALSKVPEMIDTLFVVLKKKELIILHWYHHLTVMLYCWAILYQAPYGDGFDGLTFGWVNSFVHILMYLSYALKAMGFKPPGDLFITLIQISQMIIGSIIAVYRVTHCVHQRPLMMAASIAMYVSYFGLFAHFFYERYVANKKAQAAKAAKAAEAAGKANGVHSTAHTNGKKTE